MKKLIPWLKSYDVQCPDGTKKTVFKSPEHAFPLSISGYEANISSKFQQELGVDGELNSGIKSKVDSLLIGLDELNNGLMLSFRSAYVGFQADPCTNSEFFTEQISKINDEQRRLTALKLQIRGFVEVAKVNPNDPDVAEHYSNLIGYIGNSAVSNADVQDAISNSTNAANRLMEGQ